jgi:hypothetical protein
MSCNYMPRNRNHSSPKTSTFLRRSLKEHRKNRVNPSLNLYLINLLSVHNEPQEQHAPSSWMFFDFVHFTFGNFFSLLIIINELLKCCFTPNHVTDDSLPSNGKFCSEVLQLSKEVFGFWPWILIATGELAGCFGSDISVHSIFSLHETTV